MMVMIRRFALAFACLTLPTLSEAQELRYTTPHRSPESTHAGGPSAAEVLGKWLKLYHKGKLDLSGGKQARKGRGAGKRKKDFISIASGLFGLETLQQMTHERELRMLCKAALKQNTAAATRALLGVAAVGLDKREYPTERKPIVVRQIGEEHLLKLTDASPLAFIVDVALGKNGSAVIRAAALRTLGARKDERYRPHLEACLRNSSARLRLAAGYGLGLSELMTAVPALADQLLRERTAAVQIQLLDALAAIAKEHGSKVKDRDLRRAVTTALGMLTKHGWNVDIATLDFLRLVRTADAVPCLIEMLQFYAKDKKALLSNDHSTAAQYQAHDLLCSLTGAVFAIDRTEQWRSWWENNQDTFTLAPAKTLGARKAGAGTSTSFFGIPVRGTRVVFIVDVSTSMKWSFDGKEPKITVAQRQLKAAVAKLSADSSINLVTFARGQNAWKDKLVPANKSNKKSFFAYVDKLRCGPYTNVWAGLKRGLELEVVVHGSRYATKVDEIFVLSDGAPTSGEISDPKQILATVTDLNRVNRIRINTIFIEGEGDKGRGGQPQWDMSGAELMKKIAEQNGGRFLNPRGK